MSCRHSPKSVAVMLSRDRMRHGILIDMRLVYPCPTQLLPLPTEYGGAVKPNLQIQTSKYIVKFHKKCQGESYPFSYDAS